MTQESYANLRYLDGRLSLKIRAPQGQRTVSFAVEPAQVKPIMKMAAELGQGLYAWLEQEGIIHPQGDLVAATGQQDVKLLEAQYTASAIARFLASGGKITRIERKVAAPKTGLTLAMLGLAAPEAEPAEAQSAATESQPQANPRKIDASSLSLGDLLQELEVEVEGQEADLPTEDELSDEQPIALAASAGEKEELLHVA